jgi:MFS family permease
MNGLFQAGGVIGTLLLPNIADRFGRRAAAGSVSYTISLTSIENRGSVLIWVF